MAGCGCDDVEITDANQKGVLIWLLVINAGMFVGEGVVGLLAQSTGLLADALDMLADASVYGIALYAVGRAATIKTRAARWSGFFQIALAATVLLDIVRRFIFGSDPEPLWMMIVGLVALAANVTCLLLLQRHRHGEVHMRASWIFSKNDVIANVGVIVAGGLVALLNSRWPDLIVGLTITTVVFRGGLQILRDARSSEPPKNGSPDSGCG